MGGTGTGQHRCFSPGLLSRLATAGEHPASRIGGVRPCGQEYLASDASGSGPFFWVRSWQLVLWLEELEMGTS